MADKRVLSQVIDAFMTELKQKKEAVVKPLPFETEDEKVKKLSICYYYTQDVINSYILWCVFSKKLATKEGIDP
jgi:hypothetical protein